MFYYTEQLIDHKQNRDNSGKIEWRDRDKNKKKSSQEVTKIFWKHTWKPSPEDVVHIYVEEKEISRAPNRNTKEDGQTTKWNLEFFLRFQYNYCCSKWLKEC